MAGATSIEARPADAALMEKMLATLVASDTDEAEYICRHNMVDDNFTTYIVPHLDGHMFCCRNCAERYIGLAAIDRAIEAACPAS